MGTLHYWVVALGMLNVLVIARSGIHDEGVSADQLGKRSPRQRSRTPGHITFFRPAIDIYHAPLLMKRVMYRTEIILGFKNLRFLLFILAQMFHIIP